MLLYRLTRKKYADQLSGKKAALFGGRWNSVGRPVIYTSEYRSLAVLEYRVNNPLAVKDLIMLTIEVPDDSIKPVSVTELPENWNRFVPESPVAEIGDKWLAHGEFLLLKVPSVPIPEEHNYLLSPLHPHMKEVKITGQAPYLLDNRMC